MNKVEHLLSCLAEECSEVQQAVSKALRFGLYDGHPEKGITNAEDIAREMVDVLAVLEMLEENGIVRLPANILARIAQKKVKVSQYMKYAEERGVLITSSVKGGAA